MNSLDPGVIFSGLGEIGSTILVTALFVAIIEILLYLLTTRVFKTKYSLPIMLLTPAFIGLALLVVYPIAFEVRLAFSNMSLRHFKNPSFGIEYLFNNFRMIFTQPVLKQQMFFPLLLRTMLWTLIQVFSHVTFGLMLALMLNRPIKLRGFYRGLLIVPWAIPQVIAALAWRGEFHFEFGYINVMLRSIGLEGINWKSNPFWNYVAMNITNIWLGVPFMMVILLGGLQSIPQTYYEAAEIDGASVFNRFRNVTLPLLQPVMTPAVVMGIIWTFNNFNVPFFINEFELESSDILVTALFRAAFEYNRYGFAAALSMVIFAILFVLAVLYVKITGFNPRAAAAGKGAMNMTVTGRKKAQATQEVTA